MTKLLSELYIIILLFVFYILRVSFFFPLLMAILQGVYRNSVLVVSGQAGIGKSVCCSSILLSTHLASFLYKHSHPGQFRNVNIWYLQANGACKFFSFYLHFELLLYFDIPTYMQILNQLPLNLCISLL